MKKQPATTARTRQIFIETFCDLYRQKPIEKISIQEISKNAGFNRSTFYQYFTDIYHLLECLENESLAAMRKTAQSEPCTYDPANVRHIVYLFEEKEQSLEALLGEYGSLRFLERLKKELFFDELTGRMEKENPLFPYLMEFKISTAISLFRLWQSRQKDLSSEELIDLIQTLYSSAVRPYE